MLTACKGSFPSFKKGLELLYEYDDLEKYP